MVEITHGTEDELWAEIWRLRAAIRGPDGFATWQEAAEAERILRVKAVATLVVASDHIATLEASLAAAERDAQRLDAVQAMTTGYGRGWILRESATGRGMRLHETSLTDGLPSVREAIDAATGKKNG